MMGLLIIQSALIILMLFALLAMYDHIKLFKFLVESFVTTVQKLCDNSVRESKNMGANIMAVKDVIKNANGVLDTVKGIDSIAQSLSNTATNLKSEVSKIKKG